MIDDLIVTESTAAVHAGKPQACYEAFP